MHLLSTDSLELVTANTATLAVLVKWADLNLTTGVVTPGRTPTLINSATTTVVCAAPADANHIREVISIRVSNYDPTIPATPELRLDVSGVHYPVSDPLLGAGEKFTYSDLLGAQTFDTAGRLKQVWDDPRIFTKTLSADQSNSTITLTEVVGLTLPVGPGTYQWNYMCRLQSPVATTGHRLSVNHDGTVTDFSYNRRFMDISQTAATAAPDQDQVLATGAVMAGFAARAKSVLGLGTTLSVDTVNVDMLEILEGRMTVTVSGNLELWHGSEVAAGVATIKAGSNLVLIKTD